MSTLVTLATLLAEFRDQGPARRMAGFCPVGNVLNATQDTADSEPSLQEMRAQMREALRAQEMAEDHDCFLLGSCSGCKLGQEMFSESLMRYHDLTLMEDAGAAFFRVYAKVGSTRRFPQTCGVGKALDNLLRLRDSMPEVAPFLQAAVEQIDDHHGCSSHVSCLSCARGQEEAMLDLVDLLEAGLPSGWETERISG